MGKNYYDILGISKNASKEEIKKAYRKLAHEHHPDKHGGDEKKFKELNEAYQVLSDDTKKAQYDQYGRVFEGGGSGFGAGGFGFDFNRAGFDFSSAFGGESFGIGDIFEEFFGSMGGRARTRSHARHWSTLEMPLSLTQAILGGPVEIETNKGKIKLDIPAGIQSGEAIRYQNKDINVVFVIKIKTPRTISKRAKELLEELKKEGV